MKNAVPPSCRSCPTRRSSRRSADLRSGQEASGLRLAALSAAFFLGPPAAGIVAGALAAPPARSLVASAALAVALAAAAGAGAIIRRRRTRRSPCP